MQRRDILVASAATLAACGLMAQEPPYPARPISMLIGYTAGGLTDVLTRTLAERMSRDLGQAIAEASEVAPPALLSTTMACPRSRDMRSARVRVSTSVRPPAV